MDSDNYDEDGYEEEEDEDFVDEEEESFDVSEFVDLEDNTINAGESDDYVFTMETTSSSSKVQEEEEDPDKLEEKLKILEEVFVCVPRVLIKRVLGREDVKGDIEMASQKLQEFQDMDNPGDLFKSPTKTKPSPTRKTPGSGDISQPFIAWPKAEDRGRENKEESSSRVEQSPKEDESESCRGKKRRRKKKNNRNENRVQRELREVENEAGEKGGNQVFPDQVFPDQGARQGGRIFGRRPRGGPKWVPRGGSRGGPRGGFVQGQVDNQADVLQELEYGFSSGGYTSQTQRGYGNWRGRGNQPKPKPKPRGRGYRGRGNNFQNEDEYPSIGFRQEGDPFCQQYDQPQFTQRGRGRDQSSYGRGRSGQGARGRREGPVYLADLSKSCETHRSFDNLDFGDDRGGDPNRSDQGNRGSGNRRCDQREMRRAQSLSSVDDSPSADRRQNEKEESRFERNKLLVSGLSESTTDDGVLNFIEAMSGEEVQEIKMLGKDKALVTMAEDLTNFRKIKEKGEKRGLDSARVSIERVTVCTSILVTGISENTTHDAIELYFESQRNQGGPVESVQFKPKSGRAVVVFQDPRDMERILARQQEKPHVLNKAQLSVRIFHELLEDDDDEASSDSGGLGATADGTDNQRPAAASQRPEPKGKQLHMAVDPDVMEYVTTTSLHDQLKMAMATKKSEINWKPNSKTAVIVYRGEDKSDSWQSECIEEVQTYLSKFTKRDVEVNKDFWKAVIAQLSAIHACFGVDPPLVKTIEESFVARIVSLSSDAKKMEQKLKTKLEEIYREETRKTYVKKKEDVPVEHLTLLKKIKFAEKLQEKNKELEIKLDTEAEEIYFEGPQQQFMEATMKFHKQISGMVEKKLSLSGSILEVLSSDQGLQAVKYELEKNNVEAVFVIDSEARIVGTSAAQANKAGSLVSKLTLEEKVLVDDKSQHLLKTSEWRQLCEQLNAETAVRVHRNNWNDTYVAGFREDVNEAMKTLTAYLEKNCIREEQFKCSSKIVRRYLSELRQDDLRSIATHLADFEVNIQTGKGDDDFVISGNKEGLKRAKRKLDALTDSIESEKFDVKQPGLRKYFASGKGDRLVKSVEKDHACAIHVQKQDDVRTRATEASIKSDSSSSDDDEDDEEEEMEDAVGGNDLSALVMRNGHKISWKPGNIETEQADILVSSQGACNKAMINAAGMAMKQNLVTPNAGDITVTPGFSLACRHVIHSNCSQWQGGKGEQVLRGTVQKCLQKNEELGGTSIAFPVIGAGNLNFPPDAASRIMLEEAITFCQANPSSTLKDIRFVVFQQDLALITAFTQEMANMQSKYKVRPAYTMGGLFRHLRSKFRRTNQLPAKATGGVSVEVLQGNLCLETTDAIVNINSKDMNMDKAGALCKAVKLAGGQGVQNECNQLGHQPGGSAVMTSGGNLAASHIIHLIPDSADKNHLQQCVEKCLGLAEASGIQSISFPAVGTGAFNMSAADSASLIFQALSRFNANFNFIRKVRIVVFQAPMLQAFQQEQQRHSLFSNHGGALPRVSGRGVGRTRVSRHGGFSVEVINGDLTQENTDAIMNILSTDMNMQNAGELSKAILAKGGQQIQQECSQMGKQTSGTAVMTGGGGLAVRHVIHIIPGSSDKQHLQTCLEAGLQLADTNNLHSISIPSVGTGGYGLAAVDSAQVTFQALNSFSGSCQNVRKVRVVVYQAQMVQEFLQEQQGQAMQDMDEQESDSSSEDSVARQPRIFRQPRKSENKSSAINDHSVKISVSGKDKASVGKAVDALKKGFSEACTTEKVENETVSKLSQKQINTLSRKAKDRDVRLEIEADVDRIVVRGEPTEVTGMVGEIWSEINERNKKIQEEEQAMMVSKNIEWSYEIHGQKMVFVQKTNAKIEMAHSKNQHTIQVPLRGDEFDLDLRTKTGRGRQNHETITLSRKLKGAEEGIALPNHWAPMPPSEKTVYKVQLLPGSSEYQDVLGKMQATTGVIRVQKIERVQNPHLYQSYMVKKQKMDKDNAGNSERQLFHGTDGKNISHINAQGFNRSFSGGAHGTAFGRGVYFARDASYSVGYARGGAGGRHMYLARVLVGKYCVGNPNMIVPPPKDSSRPEILHDSVVNQMGNPSIFVVFFDNQCYPEYLITF